MDKTQGKISFISAWISGHARNRLYFNNFASVINSVLAQKRETVLTPIAGTTGDLVQIETKGDSASACMYGHDVQVRVRTVQLADQPKKFVGSLEFSLADEEQPFYVAEIDDDGYWFPLGDRSERGDAALVSYTGATEALKDPGVVKSCARLYIDVAHTLVSTRLSAEPSFTPLAPEAFSL